MCWGVVAIRESSAARMLSTEVLTMGSNYLRCTGRGWEGVVQLLSWSGQKAGGVMNIA